MIPGVEEGIAGAVKGVAGPLFNLIDELFTSDDERNQAKIKLVQLEQQGKLDTLKTQMSAILAEAQSSDKWTSRARPGFLYVVYLFILFAIPMGFVFAFEPTVAKSVTVGVKDWLDSIPEPMWVLFGTGYLGYTGARSWDKKNKVAK